MTPTQFRAALKRLGLSGYQAATALGLSRRTITRYLNHVETPRAVVLALSELGRRKSYLSQPLKSVQQR